MADARAVEARLDALLPAIFGNRLRAAMRYAILGQGKRLRPFFVLESSRLHDVNDTLALNVACALECVHCYSLVHDDLPAMDNDNLRRGQPTTHRKFDEATAILAGDALLTFAFEILSAANAPVGVFGSLAKASGPDGMVGGQMLDIEAETGNFSSLAEISNMQQKKTGALFAFACTAGAVLAKADAAPLQLYAEKVGLAFQITDDVLDVESDASILGKATGKDSGRGKATFVDFLGLGAAKAESEKRVEEAIAALSPYGTQAGVLSQAARFMITRRK
ncbi:MAG: polyprenyl synthetase family protein [Alphaproteobacteria bacterium]|nr:polyprenyl synthetase family protein [Alphaproteobacteria bacterium]